MWNSFISMADYFGMCVCVIMDDREEDAPAAVQTCLFQVGSWESPRRSVWHFIDFTSTKCHSPAGILKWMYLYSFRNYIYTNKYTLVFDGSEHFRLIYEILANGIRFGIVYFSETVPIGFRIFLNFVDSFYN